MTLTAEDYTRAAAKIGCEPAAVQAVASVESAGSGFNPDGSPKSLFEGHWFHKLTQGRYTADHPTISYPIWTRQFYGKTWQAEQARLAEASSLDDTAALMSASFGRFQIMGLNFAACGFRTVQDFHQAMCAGEGQQLDAFVAFIQHRGLADELQEHRWGDFARLYNGPSYAVNQYDVKIAAAFAQANRA